MFARYNYTHLRPLLSEQSATPLNKENGKGLLPMSIVVESINIYPIKSTQGHSLQQAQVQARGLANDRRWMVVDDEGQFITARKYPKLLAVIAQPDGRALHLQSPGREPLSIGDAQAGQGEVPITVWRSRLNAQWVDAKADRWFSDLLGLDCRLVFMSEHHQRAINPDFGKPGDHVSFADGYPLLLANQASIAELNERSSIVVEMQRFRPNVSITGAPAYAEDDWQQIRIGDIEFDIPKPCDRCVMTTIDPVSLQADAQREPLRTLSTYRNDKERGILFGMNLIPRGTGLIKVGDTLTVLR